MSRAGLLCEPEAARPRPRRAPRARRLSSARPPSRGPRPGAWLTRGVWALGVALVASLPWLAALAPVQRLFLPLRHEPELVGAAAEAEVDPWLLAALVFHESGFRRGAVSEVGARGLTQLMPATAAWAAQTSGLDLGPGPLDLEDPSTNLRLGAWYLGWLLERYAGDPVLALAAYNGGQHTVDGWCEGRRAALTVQEVPYPETRCFVQKVLASRARYQRLYPGLGRGARPPEEVG